MPSLVMSSELSSELSSEHGETRARPLLTLATATYRRAKELAALLRSYERDVPPHADEVEIVVCDNASGAEPEEVVRAFMARRPELAVRFYQQAENVGVDRNILDVLSLAKGRFVWFLADDDEIAPGKLDEVLEVLRGLDSEILVVRSDNVGEWDSLPPTGVEGVQWIDAGLPRWAPMLFATPFLASIVFRVESLREVLPKAEPLVGTCYAAWGLTLTLLSRAARVPYIDARCVLGNANFRGESTFQTYRVMIDGRLKAWDLTADGRVREALRPLMVRHALAGLRGAAAATLVVQSRGELVARYGSSFGVLGPTMLRGLPWVVTAVTLPKPLRRALDEARQSVRGRAQ